MEKVRKIPIGHQALLQEIAQGDQRAFRTLYNSYHRKIYTFALKYIKSENQAEEIVQEVFMKLWQMGTRITEIKHLENYLLTITRNRSMDIMYRRQMEIKVDLIRSIDWEESHNDTEELILLNDTRKLLLDAIDLLPPQQKKVYQLCHQQGLKYEQAANQLELSQHTVQRHMKLALRFLRNYLREHTDVSALLIIFKLLG
ncbi:RNA polymerase sigma-70 factor [Pedobacter helvus]|uniref:RNA polymerase sigma-70 factor n=1 Tax=Pedobacter helvus TaxID=2563444 RepID=A0ABW9JCR5_9SPHI|nr:RNA polymerase sigma-70 factor [Pedobacter ureilyticus]